MAAVSLRCRRRCDAPGGLTLVELLVTLMIIGILSSSVLFAMSLAQESARKARTRALIASLHSMIMERWDSYQTLRIKIGEVDEHFASGQKSASGIRLKYLRMYMKADFPDQWRDEENINTGPDSVGFDKLGYLPLTFNYMRGVVVNYIATKSGLTDPLERTALLERNEGAECLYMIIKALRSDNANWQKIGDDFVGDTDQDSAPEFLDGWGRPISFIRWPAGFASEMQNGVSGSCTAQEHLDAAKLDHDPFDPLWTDLWGYRLVPLIVSAGPDGLFDIATVQLDSSNNNDMNFRWYPYYAKNGRRAGETYDQNGNGTQDWHDNIHNHLINAR